MNAVPEAAQVRGNLPELSGPLLFAAAAARVGLHNLSRPGTDMSADCGIVDLPGSVLQQILAALAGQPDSLTDLCCCLCVCKQWHEAASCKEYWRHIDVPFSRADRLTSAHLEKLASRSSNQALSLKLSGCRKVRTFSIMQVLLHNHQLEEVDLSYCYQVGVHNVELFLHKVSTRPNHKLKHLTAGSRGNGYWRHISKTIEQEARAAGISLHDVSDMPR